MLRTLLLTLMSGLLVGVCAPGPLAARDPWKGEVFGTVGIAKTYDDEGSLGKGFNGGGGLGYRVSPRFGVEFEINGFRTRREFASAFPPFEASGAHITGNGLWYLGRGRTQPYLLFGAGLLHFNNESGFSGTPLNLSGNGLTVDFGAGLKIFVSEHVSLRPDFRIYAGRAGSAVEAPFSAMRISIGAGYHW